MEPDFTIGFITKFGDLDRSLIAHYKDIGDSLLSWMVMLDDEEFEDLRREVNCFVQEGKIPDFKNILPILVHFKGLPKEGDPLNAKDIDLAVSKIRTSFALISLCRRGLLNYEPAKKDDNWAFSKKDLSEEDLKDIVLKEYQNVH